jgi:hypothetical protein
MAEIVLPVITAGLGAALVVSLLDWRRTDYTKKVAGQINQEALEDKDGIDVNKFTDISKDIEKWYKYKKFAANRYTPSVQGRISTIKEFMSNIAADDVRCKTVMEKINEDARVPNPNSNAPKDLCLYDTRVLDALARRGMYGKGIMYDGQPIELGEKIYRPMPLYND